MILLRWGGRRLDCVGDVMQEGEIFMWNMKGESLNDIDTLKRQ